MYLRALTINKEFIEFDVKDVPVGINDRMSILTNSKNSEIIYTNSISRCENNIHEFDYCLDSHMNKLGYVIYVDNKFRLNTGDSFEEVNLFKDNCNIQSINVLHTESDPIMVGDDNVSFNIRSILMLKDDKVYYGRISANTFVYLKDLKLDGGN